MNREKLNTLWIGLIAGIAVPVIALSIYYYLRSDGLGFANFLKVYKNLGILTHIVSLSVLPDLLVFFLFIQLKMLKSARGVLMATFLFTFMVLGIRFF